MQVLLEIFAPKFFTQHLHSIIKRNHARDQEIIARNFCTQLLHASFAQKYWPQILHATTAHNHATIARKILCNNYAQKQHTYMHFLHATLERNN